MSSSGRKGGKDLQRADLLRISQQISASHGFRGPHAPTTELVLMEIDPRRMHAYWHIDHADLLHARVAVADPCASLIIRLCDVDPESGWVSDESPVPGLTQSHYLEAPMASTGCYAEIGLKLQDGSVYPLVRSNVAHAPRQEESSAYEMIPVDTRILPETPPDDPGFGETMPGPLQVECPDQCPPGSSWS